ncbi:PREDICTED: uncharacterized protein LOC102006831 [Chinchilla lanigera]|uniref:uncharacterized protein LOC102006831 n=1 Tax=Chinchilla lanigera TaxID=34839 RepID=UPI00038F086C|nr:PREDICTED: uncharacterized protein LOC102006831 [Chinchilla lanigera]
MPALPPPPGGLLAAGLSPWHLHTLFAQPKPASAAHNPSAFSRHESRLSHQASAPDKDNARSVHPGSTLLLGRRQQEAAACSLVPQCARSPRAMASPAGSPEDPGRLRGRDGRPRREEDDAPPEQKRLRLGLEGGSAETQDGPDAPGGEDSGAPAGGEGGGDCKPEAPALLPSAKRSSQDSVSRSGVVQQSGNNFCVFSASLV